MTIEQMKQTSFYLSRPEIIRKAMDITPPIKMYKLHGKQCFIYSLKNPNPEN